MIIKHFQSIIEMRRKKELSVITVYCENHKNCHFNHRQRKDMKNRFHLQNYLEITKQK